MKPIVISGKIGSGKSTICKLFEDHGHMTISSDMMAKDLIRTNEVIKESLIESFGADIMHKDDISLKKLRSILCSSEENKRIIDATMKRLNLSPKKVLMNIEYYGNTTAATLPLLLKDYESKLSPGNRLVFTAFGGGFTWGSIYLKWAYDSKK